MRLLIALLLFFQVAAWAQAPVATGPAKIAVGVMPAYDASGEDYGEIFAENLTQMLFEELQSSGYQPILLNPGGAYTPFDSDLVREFAQIARVDAVLVTTFQLPDKPKRGNYTLKVEAHLLDPQSGKVTPTRSYTDSIRREEAIVEGGYVGLGAAWGFGTGASRKFEKQPLGKRARSFARAIRGQAVDTIPQFATAGTTSVPVIVPGSCKVEFRVVYPRKNAISKSYGLIINGKEESLWLKEGIATVTLPNGPALILVNVADAPYRLPVQRVYAANTFVECGGSEPQQLHLEIGPAGEAFLQWKGRNR